MVLAKARVQAGWYSSHLATCFLCAISPDRVVRENEYALAFGDG
jgi:hypothetical protein